MTDFNELSEFVPDHRRINQNAPDSAALLLFDAYNDRARATGSFPVLGYELKGRTFRQALSRLDEDDQRAIYKEFIHLLIEREQQILDEQAASRLPDETPAQTETRRFKMKIAMYVTMMLAVPAVAVLFGVVVAIGFNAGDFANSAVVKELITVAGNILATFMTEGQ